MAVISSNEKYANSILSQDMSMEESELAIKK